MLMEVITTTDTCRKKECQGKGVLTSGTKIIEIKSTSRNISVQTRRVHLLRRSSNLRVRTRIKTVLLQTLDRRSLGTYFQRVC